jgi:molybdopterin-guanine dinucleotide biosynthesis protein A
MSTPSASKRLAGAILAGGRSSRFGGFPKGALRRPDGSTVVGHLLRVLDGVGVDERVIVANPSHAYGDAGCPVIHDRLPGLGPLGGIEAALRHFSRSHDAVLFLPCDLPALTVKEAGALRRAYETSGCRLVMARAGRSPGEPLCAVVDTGLLGEVRRAVRDGARSPQRLWRALAAHVVRFPDAAPFRNVNTPEEWAAWWRQEARGRARRAAVRGKSARSSHVPNAHGARK